MNRQRLMCGAFAMVLGLSISIMAKEEQSPPSTRPVKSLSQNVNQGLQWLVAHQNSDGGWGQGEQGVQRGEKSNVADTCMAAMALMRGGSDARSGPYAQNVRRAIAFVCEQIEKSDDKSLFITDQRGTRLQSKLGTYIDTFVSAQLLAKAKDQLPEGGDRKRVVAALDKTMDKIEKNQRDDGTWANEGWAPALAQAEAAKAVNRAALAGVEVNENVRQKAEQYAQDQARKRAAGEKTDGDAGVGLYAAGGSLVSIAESDKANAMMEDRMREVAAAPASTPVQRKEAEEFLRRSDVNKDELRAAQQAVVARLDDKQFIAGFGSNGGEEFLSYLNIGETLLAKGGEDWNKWDKSMTENLNRIQNQDGSWSGHHCVTGRTFCTSAALMVLMLDRSENGLAEHLRRR